MAAGISIGKAPSPARRDVLARRIRLFVAATITYNVIEAVVAITAGTIASSTALIGFGFDSVVEVSSATAVASSSPPPDHPTQDAREGAPCGSSRCRSSRSPRSSALTPSARWPVRARPNVPFRHRHSRPLPRGHAVLSYAQRAARPRAQPRARSPTPSRRCCAPTCRGAPGRPGPQRHPRLVLGRPGRPRHRRHRRQEDRRRLTGQGLLRPRPPGNAAHRCRGNRHM